MDVLVVTEDAVTVGLSTGLIDTGCHVEFAENEHVGLSKILERFYDLIVIDVGQDLQDAWTIVENLRLAGAAIATLFLGSRTAMQGPLSGDAFLAPPFTFDEYCATIQAFIRRSHKSEASTTPLFHTSRTEESVYLLRQGI